MDLEKIGLDANIFLKIKKIAIGENISFTDKEIEKIRKTVEYGKNGGKLSHIADTTRKKTATLKKKIYENVKENITNKKFDSLSIQEKIVLKDELNNAESTKKSYNELISKLKKLVKKGAKNKNDIASEILKNLQSKKHDITTSMKKLLERKANEKKRKFNIGFMTGLISDNEIDELLFAIGKDKNWYYSQFNFYKSQGYTSEQAIELIKNDISDIAVDIVSEYTQNESFINDDGSNMSRNQINERMVEIGINKTIVKFLDLLDGTRYLQDSQKQANQILEMWSNDNDEWYEI